MSASTLHDGRTGWYASFRAGLPDRLDGLCLLGLGAFMAALARSRLYWNFLNPKFSHLTLTAGALLCLAALPPLLRPRPGRETPGRLARQTFLALFLALAVLAWRDAALESAPSGSGAFDPAPHADAAAAPNADVPVDLNPVVGNVPYVRLNLAELYIMVDKGRKDYPAHFALRAEVMRAPRLGEHGYVLLRRVAVVCCLADSLDLRFLTRGQAGAEVDTLKDGDWVEVYGRLEALKGADAGLPKLAPRGEGPGLAITNPKFRIQAEHVERIKGADFPYLFEFREKEPFAW
ncbi:MAG: hypothetical protein AUJ49_11600 [Desulfovibrionaceae bacterium CG1_02_65_16]|nr:MAG: hypothetical protein AUJ49_11600 [Desulfovibrionaceae bacterium CG1_02_65_16]